MIKKFKTLWSIAALFVLGVLICTMHVRQLKSGLNTMKRRSEHTLIVTSDAFQDGQRIPDKYTCSGDSVSPQISWSNVPSQAKTIALICDDPDAPREDPWVHWVIFNIPTTQQELSEAINADQEKLRDGSCQGINSFGKIGYGGACPPLGHGIHHYYFKLYALDMKLKLESGATKTDLETAMIGHIVATGELMGTYSREK